MNNNFHAFNPDVPFDAAFERKIYEARQPIGSSIQPPAYTAAAAPEQEGAEIDLDALFTDDVVAPYADDDGPAFTDFSDFTPKAAPAATHSFEARVAFHHRNTPCIHCGKTARHASHRTWEAK